MDEGKDPVDILDEILNRRSQPPRPSPTSYPPRFDPPSPEDIPPPTPTGKKPPPAERLLPWLCTLLGGAVLALVLCGLQLFSVNARLDGLQSAVGKIEAADTLLNEKKLLQRDIDVLQNRIESLEEQLNGVYLSTQEQLGRQLRGMRQSEYLYYMERFAASGDLTMAALVMTLEDDALRSPDPQNSVRTLNPIQQERYDNIRQLLEDEGLLYSSGLTQINGTTPLWPSGSGPSEDPDTAALGILWCALDACYVEYDFQKAAEFLILYQNTPLGRTGSGQEAAPYPQRIRNTASEETIQMYEQLIRGLIDVRYLTETDGVLDYAPDLFHVDILYSLPFELPIDTASIKLGSPPVPDID